MRVLLSTYGSRGDVYPMVGLALALRELGAEAVVSAPPDFERELDRVGLPFVPAGPSVRQAVAGSKRWRSSDLRERSAELITAQFEALSTVAAGCDVLVATGLFPSAAAARTVAEKLGIGYQYVSFIPTLLPSPHHRPFEYPERTLPPDETDNRVLWDLDVQHMNDLFVDAVNDHRTSVGLPPVASVRDYVITDRPWLAADPLLGPWAPADLDVTQTGAWIAPDERPLPAELAAFLTDGPPPVYVGFGSMPLRESAEVVKAAIEAIRTLGHRALLSQGWAKLALIDDRDDCFAVGDVNHQALFARVAAVVHHGGAGTTTTAARAGAPQVVVPQLVDQPYWAARVAELGIGVAHDGPNPTFESLSVALKGALAAETRARAMAVAPTIRTDGAAVAANLLLNRSAK